ncbi:hypothetical protein [Kitasatospora sp. NPDC088548]|uniref:hypothetical protein n=1 Tax=Kitasatospora sp. NPDC088548 TaxID=3364075 RepID=UPI003805460E
MTKKNTSRAAARARQAQQAGSTAPYTALLRGTAQSGGGTPSLRTLPVALGVSAPCRTAAERRECAQVVADALTELTDLNGAQYPATAHVLVLTTQDVPDFVVLMASVNALRDWSGPHATDEAVDDMKRALLTALAERWPDEEQYAVGIEAIGNHRFNAAKLTLTEDQVHSTAPGFVLDQAAAQPTRSAVQLAPVVRGGEGKTIAISDQSAAADGHGRHPVVVDVDSQPDLTAWSDAQEEPPGGWPYRLVDAQWQGWLTAGNGLYRASYSFKREGLEQPWPYARIVAERGPVRPVNHEIEGDDSAERLAALWEQAGRKAVASTLVALYRAEQRLPRLVFGGPHPLTSGREGSWESERLLSLAWEIGEELSEKPRRYDEAVAEGIADIVEGWVRHPESYTEVADHLSVLFGRHADRAGGWKAVADQQFQPGARVGQGSDTVFAVATWLMKSSTGFDADQYR